LSALSFSHGNPDVARLVPQYVLDICSPLVEERRDTTLAFIHVSVKDFLQGPESVLTIRESEANREHGVASIAILLAGLDVLDTTYCESTRSLRLIRGVHGLHNYATEFWTEYILADAAIVGGLDRTSQLCILADRLASRLHVQCPRTEYLTNADDRLKFFEHDVGLYGCISAALKARSRQRLESELLQDTGKTFTILSHLFIYFVSMGSS
jgi:hypothetical protein